MQATRHRTLAFLLTVALDNEYARISFGVSHANTNQHGRANGHRRQ
jgi:hypothetical protein